jgi:hypothetical protein
MATYPNPSKALHLLAHIQEHMNNGTIHHEIGKITKHTRDKEVLAVCERVAKCLQIEIDQEFERLDDRKYASALKVLQNHLRWASDRFDEVVALRADIDPTWIDSPFSATEQQLLTLSDCYTLLDKVPDVCDANGEVVKVGDLVSILCSDETGESYEHYGVLVSSPKGFRVAHFFTGSTIKAQNNLVEKGFGYIHEVNYDPFWIVKEHLPSSVPYSQVEQRIKLARQSDKRIWNKLTYNCEHWAREMFSGTAECTQLAQWREKARKREKE